jgi:hypothetical protein
MMTSFKWIKDEPCEDKWYHPTALAVIHPPLILNFRKLVLEPMQDIASTFG